MKNLRNLFCLFLALMWAYPSEAQDKTQIYQRVKVFCNTQQFNALARAGVSLDHLAEKTPAYIVGEFSEWEMTQIRSLATRTEVLIPDLTTYYRERLSSEPKQSLARGVQSTPNGFNYGTMGGYLKREEMALELDSLFMQYPQLVSQKVSIGNSLEGRPIWMVKISDNPTVDENEPEVLYTGVHHAREVITVTELIYFMQYLVQNYGVKPEITHLLQNRELYFVPIVNPDGYAYNETNFPEGGGMWRKNRRLDTLSGYYGVDLNRNYAFNWGYDNIGSSPNGNSEVYRGDSAFSEPETQVMRNFCISRQFKTAINAHSYSNLLLYPWGYDFVSSPNDDLYSIRGALMTQENGYIHGSSPNVLYAVNGDANDWMYGEESTKPQIMSATSETGSIDDGFWPMQSRILPLCEEMIPLLLDNAWFAGEYLITLPPTLHNTPNKTFAIPVQTTNYSHFAASNVSVAFVSNSPYLLSSGAIINNLPSAETQTYNIPVVLANNTPANQLIQGVMRTTFTDGYFIDEPMTIKHTGQPLSVQNLSSFSQCFLYPNPNNGQCSVHIAAGLLEPTQIEIFDIQGKKVYQTAISSQKIDLSGLGIGLYYYRFMASKSVGNMQKIVIR